MKISVVFVLILLFSYLLGLWLSGEKKTDLPVIVYASSCDLTRSICRIENHASVYTIQFVGEASPLTAFYVELDNLNQQPTAGEVVFEMENMQMGFNTFQLAQQGEKWRARVLLPVCSLGRNDWILKVKLRYPDSIQLTEFKFTQFSR